MYLRFRVLCIMVRIPRNEELVRYIAYRLRELRLARGLSQEKVLFETGVRVEHIEMGRNNITISTLHALHEFFTPSVEPETTDAPEPTDNPEISDDHEQETHPQ